MRDDRNNEIPLPGGIKQPTEVDTDCRRQDQIQFRYVMCETESDAANENRSRYSDVSLQPDLQKPAEQQLFTNAR